MTPTGSRNRRLLPFLDPVASRPMPKTPGPFREHLDIPSADHLAKESVADPVARYRKWTALAIAGLAIVWFAWGAFGLATPTYTPGPLSHPHAIWESSCATCHPGMTPISANNWAGRLLDLTHTADETCQGCHKMPAHREKAPAAPGCTSCHHEHRGREASLRQVADQQCLNCHRELTGVGDHPEFKRLRDKTPDPGQLKFDHALHLTAGMRRAPDAKPFLKSEVATTHRSGYQADPDGAVKLDCSSCHRPDAEVRGLAVGPARASGEAMLPVAYDKHCQGCHPLTFEKITLPHRLQPAGVREYLQAHFTARLLADGKLPTFDLLRRPLAGKQIDQAAERKSARQQIDTLVGAVERMALTSDKGCSKCHQYDRPPQTVLPAERTSLRVLPAGVPEVWLPHGRFNHAAHGQLTCETCHKEVEKKTDASAVMLPKFETCRTCHSRPSGPVQGGVRHQCVDCHAYHNADHPLQGRGAAGRRQNPRVDLEEFFRRGR